MRRRAYRARSREQRATPPAEWRRSRPVVGASGALAVRSHGAARQAIGLVSRRRDEGLRWTRANGRRLSLTSAAALVILGATTWGTVDWRRGDRAETPSFPLNTTAR